MIVAKAPGHVGEAIGYGDENVSIERHRAGHGMAALTGDEDCQAADRVADGEPHGSKAADDVVHGTRTVHQVGFVTGALTMRRQIEQHAAYTAPAQIFGEGAHERRFPGPPM